MRVSSIYEELSRDPESLERINRLHYVVSSGGKHTPFPLPKALLTLCSSPLPERWRTHIQAHTRNLQPRGY